MRADWRANGRGARPARRCPRAFDPVKGSAWTTSALFRWICAGAWGPAGRPAALHGLGLARPVSVAVGLVGLDDALDKRVPDDVGLVEKDEPDARHGRDHGLRLDES